MLKTNSEETELNKYWTKPNYSTPKHAHHINMKSALTQRFRHTFPPIFPNSRLRLMMLWLHILIGEKRSVPLQQYRAQMALINSGMQSGWGLGTLN